MMFLSLPMAKVHLEGKELPTSMWRRKGFSKGGSLLLSLPTMGSEAKMGIGQRELGL